MMTAETLERPAADAEARATSIRQVVFEQLRTVAPEADPEAIDPNADLRDVIDFDSIDLLNFTMALNKRLGIEIPEMDFIQFATLQGAIDYLTAHMGQ